MVSQRYLFSTLVILFIAYGTSLARVGQPCTDTCEGGMVCDSQTCQCPINTVPNVDQTRCLPVASVVGSGCDVELQCTKKLTSYAQCLDNKCSCKEEAIVANNMCVKKLELGESCTDDQWCRHIQNAACTSGVCACDEHHVPHSINRTLCLPVAVIFQSPCEEDIQCSKGLGDHAICHTSKMCQCEQGYHVFKAYQSSCLQNKGLLETCEPGECYLPQDGDNQNIDCVSGTCACKEGGKPSHDNQRCSGSAGLQNLGPLTALWFVVLAMSRNLF